MKKLTFGLAFLSLTAVAQAQVTVYGIIDSGISHYRVSGGESQWAVSDNAGSSSRLGFRGAESLGNGLTAGFTLEGGFEASNPGGFEFTRRATVGLTGAFGEVRLGRDYTPTFNMLGTFGTPWGTNGVGEDLIYRARATNHGSSNGGQSTNVRASNAINYFLPKDLGGFYGQFMYGMDEQVEGKAGRYIGGRLGYKTGDLNVGLAYNTAEGGLTAPASRPRDMSNLTLGVAYEFKVARVSLMQAFDTVDMPLGEKKLNGTSLGAEIPVGNGQVLLGLSQVKFSYPTDSAKARKVAIGYQHNLSKRTTLYSTAAFIKNDSGARFIAGGDVTGVANKSSSGFDVGIRHRF